MAPIESGWGVRGTPKRRETGPGRHMGSGGLVISTFDNKLETQLVFTRYGKCYMFNAAEEGRSLRTTMKGGTGNGLEIMLDIQQDEYLPVWGDTEDTAFEAGVRVQIHSQAEPPFVHELGFGVAPGFQTFVATQEQRVSDEPLPHTTHMLLSCTSVLLSL
uniref:Uncharacterized protein n=1 Tax=Knipowitschia caucasica TaxID=637954 RepID=A0AAV2KD75_KNICA